MHYIKLVKFSNGERRPLAIFVNLIDWTTHTLEQIVKGWRYAEGRDPPHYPVPSTGHAVIENCNVIFVSYCGYALDEVYEQHCWADNEMALWLSKSDKLAIEAAAEALKVFNSHDSEANLRERYGRQWWFRVSQIERELRSLIQHVQDE